MYNKIIACLDKSVLGLDVQVDTIYGFPQFGPNSICSIPQNRPIDHELNVPNLQLYRKAKFTDIIDHGIFGVSLTLSEKAFEVLDNSNSDSYQSFPLEAKRGNELQRYHAVVFTWRRMDFVDWEECEFVKWQSMGHISAGNVTIKSYEHYRELKRELKGKYSIKPTHLALYDDIEVDAFLLSNPFLGFYVSDRLRKTIEDNQLTAFNFDSLSELNDKMSVLPEPWSTYDNQ